MKQSAVMSFCGDVMTTWLFTCLLLARAARPQTLLLGREAVLVAKATAVCERLAGLFAVIKVPIWVVGSTRAHVLMETAVV